MTAAIGYDAYVEVIPEEEEEEEEKEEAEAEEEEEAEAEEEEEDEEEEEESEWEDVKNTSIFHISYDGSTLTSKHAIIDDMVVLNVKAMSTTRSLVLA